MTRCCCAQAKNQRRFGGICEFPEGVVEKCPDGFLSHGTSDVQFWARSVGLASDPMWESHPFNPPNSPRTQTISTWIPSHGIGGKSKSLAIADIRITQPSFPENPLEVHNNNFPRNAGGGHFRALLGHLVLKDTNQVLVGDHL